MKVINKQGSIFPITRALSYPRSYDNKDINLRAQILRAETQSVFVCVAIFKVREEQFFVSSQVSQSEKKGAHVNTFNQQL